VASRLAELAGSGLDPAEVAARVLAVVREDEFYVFTHHGAAWRAEVQERFDAILAAMDKAAGSDPGLDGPDARDRGRG
jgi:hypothetical protein